MKNPYGNPKEVEDQRKTVSPRLNWIDRYLNAVMNRLEEGSTEDSKDPFSWRDDHERALKFLKPLPNPYSLPNNQGVLAPDIGKFRDHNFDHYLMSSQPMSNIYRRP
jgi:hypothetical protein